MVTHFSLSDKPLYFVTDHFQTNGKSQFEIVLAALLGGVRFIQYRDKEISDFEFVHTGKKIAQECSNFGATLLLNDRVHLVKEIGADGVHLGQEDTPALEARKILGSNSIIGLSTHNEKEVAEAQLLPIDYINIGPMFATNTKDHSQYGTLGLDRVIELSRKSLLPFTSMGGIKKFHLKEIFTRGIHSIAMVTEISLAENVTVRVQELLEEINSVKYPRIREANAFPTTFDNSASDAS